jgi:hypothetical protein
MKKSAAAIPVVVATALVPMSAMAYDLNTIGALSQSEFRLLSEDLGAALSYKPIIPSEATGVTGFDLGLAASGTDLKNPLLLSKAANGAEVRTLMPVVSARVDKGLPANIDIGAVYSVVPGTDVKSFGGEVRWAFLPGSTAIPAVAVRASGSKLTGVDQLNLTTYGLDVSVSKGLAIFTPYGGLGMVWVHSSPNGVATLQEEKFTQTKFFAGVNINIGVNFDFEYDNTGSINTFSAKVGFRF